MCERRHIDAVVSDANAPDHPQPRRGINFGLAEVSMSERQSIDVAQQWMQALWRILVVEKDAFDVPAFFYNVPTGARETLR
jgi:hypothetical protein